MELKLYKPTKPFTISQPWGNPNKSYAEHFDDPDFQLHNGLDFKPNLFDPSGYLVYCPADGFVVSSVDYSPDGGGNEVWLVSEKPVQMFERECYAYIALCHAEKIFVKAGDRPKVGELLMIGDNTGFSTGPHTHLGLYRMEQNGAFLKKIDENKATGSFDPYLFMVDQPSGKEWGFAVDQADLATLIKNAFRYYAYLSGLK